MSVSNPERFDQFMNRALHDPVRGYYARRIRGLGGRGDFTTSPMLSGLPARAIAAWAVRAMKESSCRDLVEIGPGEGILAEAVMGCLPWSVRWRTRLHLVETSAPLMEIQKKRLGKRAIWHRTPAEALQACRGRAVMFSNELVDAFPVRRFEKTTDGWLEVGVETGPAGRVGECLLPVASLPESSVFSQDFRDGQRVEVHDSYRDWLAGWMPLWKAGRMLTVDYGATVDRVYQRRPFGTLRGYLMHQRVEGAGIYQNIGMQDLTADVNFTDLAEWTRPWTEDCRLMEFSEFLAGFSRAGHAADARFLDSGDAGGAFMVLDQKRRRDP